MFCTPEFVAAEVAYRTERASAEFRVQRRRRLIRALAIIKGSSS